MSKSCPGAFRFADAIVIRGGGVRASAVRYLDKLTTAALAILSLGTVIGTAIVLFNPARFYLYVRPDALAAAIAIGAAAFFAFCVFAAVRGHAVAVIGLAIVIRLGAFLAFAVYPGGGDSPLYDNVARNIVAGHGILWTNTFYLEPLAFRAYFPPLYSSLLAGTYAVFGPGPWPAFLLNAVADALVVLSLCQLARPLGYPKAGLVAGAIYLILPQTMLYSLGIQKESLAIFFLLQIVIGLWKRQAVRIGAFTAALALTQPAWLTVVAALGLAFIPRLGPLSLLALRSLPLFLLLMAPWWIRNYLLLGEFVPLGTAYGHNLLYIATNRFDTIKQFVPLGNEPAVMKAAYSAAIEIIRADPLKYFLGRIIRVVESMCLDGFPMQLLQYGKQPAHFIMAGFYTCQISYSLFMGTAAFALAKDRRSSVTLLLLAAGIAVIFGMWFEFSERHRYFITPLLALLIAIFGETTDKTNPDPLRGAGGAALGSPDRDKPIRD